MCTLTCRQCGAPIERKRLGPAPTYCSPQCRRAHRTQEELAQRHSKGCKVCGAPREYGHCYCRACRQAGVRHRARVRHGRPSQLSAQQRILNPDEPTLRPDTPVVRPRPRSRRERAARKLANAARGQRPTHTWYQGTCAYDGTMFVSNAGPSGPKRFCSEACHRAENSARRRARKCGADRVRYRRIDIFERVDWMCNLCGGKTERGAPWLHPLEPVIDHVVPLGKRGADAPYNLACTHRICNAIKSDREVSSLPLPPGCAVTPLPT